jgi:hypothetical protein
MTADAGTLLRQPRLPFDDPINLLPSDGRARMIFAWRGPSGRLNRQWAAEIDDVPTVRHLLREQPDVYDTQWWMAGTVRRHAFALAGTHAFADLDTYRVPALADEKPDAIGRDVLRFCDREGIPRPSALICSGRGEQVKWCFDRIVGREDVGRMVALNRALARRLAAFGADPKATDATRLLRVTGSRHSGADRIVEVLHLETSDGRTVTYDPHVLADMLAPHDRAPDVGVILPQPSEMVRGRIAPNGWSRAGWHWSIVEDIRRLAVIRWYGVVPNGWRDNIAFLIACQLLRIFPPREAYRETLAVVSTLIEPDFLRRELDHLAGTATRLARDAWAGRGWVHTYRHGKQTLIDELQITAGEMPHMRALIDEAEDRRRRAARERARRAAAGAAERDTWLGEAADRAATARLLRAEGLSWADVASRMGLPTPGAARKLASRANFEGKQASDD